MIDYRRCPTPSKRAFVTEREAADRLRLIQRRPYSEVVPCRYYLCACGGYHLASTPLRVEAST